MMRRLVWHLVWTFAIFAFLLGLLGFFLGTGSRVHAHDIYSTLRDGPTGTGQLCCGGDEKTGDCEAVRYEINVDGSAIFTSRRYGGASVLIAHDKITWLPVPGGEANEAHWCGVPRTKVFLAPVNNENPDPTFWTYCAFIAPGGV
jgi:hypothetical protein